MLVFILNLFIAPIILILLLIIPKFIISFFERPKLKRVWTSLHENLPTISFTENDLVFIKNIRNAKYFKSEWDNKVSWENKKYKLSGIKKLNLYVNPYAFLQSHVIVEFEFSEGASICVSYEIRKTHPEKFKIYKVLYENYESYYCVSVPEDILYVRKNIRKSKLFKFEISCSREKIIELFKLLADDINIYSKKPFFYRILFRNCISQILNKMNTVGILNFSSRLSFLNVLKLVYKNKENISREKKMNFKKFLRIHQF